MGRFVVRGRQLTLALEYHSYVGKVWEGAQQSGTWVSMRVAKGILDRTTRTRNGAVMEGSACMAERRNKSIAATSNAELGRVDYNNTQTSHLVPIILTRLLKPLQKEFREHASKRHASDTKATHGAGMGEGDGLSVRRSFGSKTWLTTSMHLCFFWLLSRGATKNIYRPMLSIACINSSFLIVTKRQQQARDAIAVGATARLQRSTNACLFGFLPRCHSRRHAYAWDPKSLREVVAESRVQVED